MNLTSEQRETLKEVWKIFRVRLVECVGTTRSRDESLYDKLNVIAIDTLKLFNNCIEEESNIAMQFVEFVIETLITTKSLGKTIEKVEITYNFSCI
ncbi:hypothetical protein B0H39_005996 [Clostridium beijerinckii]|uniref:hypothetical protein n=1 Tax=Clostridium beijerinckii TaxID=1520 RepID=UPI0014948317|nr:hypothetical protein [Clostridium beijerinckii]NOW87965.1 hypothetical protein [Clostridium beijerinckii]